MCGMKLVDKKITKDLMQVMDLEETIDQLQKTNTVCWYGHVLRKDNNKIMQMLDIRVKGTSKIGRLKTTRLQTGRTEKNG